MKAKTTLWNRKGSAADHDELIAVLGALLVRSGGHVVVSNAELSAFTGGIGIRAKYLPDGGIEVWTYDAVEDIKSLHK